MQNFARFTPAFQPGDVFVRTDAVTAVTECHYPNSPTTPRVTVIGTLGNGRISVKESTSQVIEALLASEPPGVVSIEIMVPDGDTSSLADDCACHCGVTCCDDEPGASDYALALKEAQEDAKIADERAEWYKRLSERYLQTFDAEVGRAEMLRQERDSLLAKLKDTTAALEKANAELAAIPRDANAAHNAFINSIKSKLAEPGLYGYTKN